MLIHWIFRVERVQHFCYNCLIQHVTEISSKASCSLDAYNKTANILYSWEEPVLCISHTFLHLKHFTPTSLEGNLCSSGTTEKIRIFVNFIDSYKLYRPTVSAVPQECLWQNVEQLGSTDIHPRTGSNETSKLSYSQWHWRGWTCRRWAARRCPRGGSCLSMPCGWTRTAGRGWLDSSAGCWSSTDEPHGGKVLE